MSENEWHCAPCGGMGPSVASIRHADGCPELRDMTGANPMSPPRDVAVVNAEHFAALGVETERRRIVSWIRLQASLARKMGPVDRGECADLLADAIERGAHALVEWPKGEEPR